MSEPAPAPSGPAALPESADDAALRLTRLGSEVLALHGGDGGRALRDLALIRDEVERIARLREAGRSEAELLPPLRAALAGSGLAEVAPEGVGLAVIQAGLLRLTRLVAALAITQVRKGA